MPREAKLPPRVGATALRGKPKHSFKAERRLKMVESAEKERIKKKGVKCCSSGSMPSINVGREVLTQLEAGQESQN